MRGPSWTLGDAELDLCRASEEARLAGRWDVVAKIEEAALVVRQAVALNNSANVRELLEAVDA